MEGFAVDCNRPAVVVGIGFAVDFALAVDCNHLAGFAVAGYIRLVAVDFAAALALCEHNQA